MSEDENPYVDVLYKYNRLSKWRRGRTKKIMVGDNTMLDVYVYVKNAKVLDWNKCIRSGVPGL